MAAKKKTRKKAPKTKKKSAKKKPVRKKTTKKKAAAKPKKPAPFDLIVAALRRNPKAVYANIRDAAARKRLTIYPVMFGRAKLLLGLVKAKPKKKAKVSKRGPGRPPKTGAKRRVGRPRKTSTAGGALENIVAQIGEMQRERDRLRRTVARLRELVHTAIS